MLHHALPETASGPSKKGSHCINAGRIAQRMPNQAQNTRYCVSLRRRRQPGAARKRCHWAATNGKA
ncbi:hypothetical protein ppKF707_0919 [Metapseudomonas furukawaii]|uniref:Uncharacterized protein n=1 Tax=Metapseudomonas furukawaii TaxID=1149133 RepID=A0AAD1C2I0_METFU|nr:hypothetical protein ppKF707_0919 [Pseudomonas furukawaii]BAU75411.1 hypothetical protein KF707C_37230 [Pseudomonas furukawaii]